MFGSVLYMGDTRLDDAAAYLAGLMTYWKWDFEYIPSVTPAPKELFDRRWALIVLSDYPASQIDPVLQRRVIEQVAEGAGLLMCGGWESFHGCGGDWDHTPIAEILPVEISSFDDRVNCDSPLLVAQVAAHPATVGLPWNERPPVIGGFNRFTSKSDATVVLESHQFSAARSDSGFSFEFLRTDPLLVCGQWGRGRTAALATDVAPHWVGPLVDWGTTRIAAQAKGGNEIEVGSDYARFLRQLLDSTAGA